MLKLFSNNPKILGIFIETCSGKRPFMEDFPQFQKTVLFVQALYYKTTYRFQKLIDFYRLIDFKKYSFTLNV